jgi:hypothetical protein
VPASFQISPHGARVAMKLTKNEIVLLAAVLFALIAGEVVKRFREAHPVPLPLTKPIPKK